MKCHGLGFGLAGESRREELVPGFASRFFILNDLKFLRLELGEVAKAATTTFSFSHVRFRSDSLCIAHLMI